MKTPTKIYRKLQKGDVFLMKDYSLWRFVRKKTDFTGKERLEFIEIKIKAPEGLEYMKSRNVAKMFLSEERFFEEMYQKLES